MIRVHPGVSYPFKPEWKECCHEFPGFLSMDEKRFRRGVKSKLKENLQVYIGISNTNARRFSFCLDMIARSTAPPSLQFLLQQLKRHEGETFSVSGLFGKQECLPCLPREDLFPYKRILTLKVNEGLVLIFLRTRIRLLRDCLAWQSP